MQAAHLSRRAEFGKQAFKSVLRERQRESPKGFSDICGLRLHAVAAFRAPNFQVKVTIDDVAHNCCSFEAQPTFCPAPKIEKLPAYALPGKYERTIWAPA